MTRHQSNLREESSGTSFVLSCYAGYSIFSYLDKLISIQSVKIDYNSRRRHSWTFGRAPPSLTRTRGVTTWRSRPAPPGSSHRRAASQTMRPTSPPARSSSIGGPWSPPRLRYMSQCHTSRHCHVSQSATCNECLCKRKNTFSLKTCWRHMA